MTTNKDTMLQALLDLMDMMKSGGSTEDLQEFLDAVDRAHVALVAYMQDYAPTDEERPVYDALSAAVVLLGPMIGAYKTNEMAYLQSSNSLLADAETLLAQLMGVEPLPPPTPALIVVTVSPSGTIALQIGQTAQLSVTGVYDDSSEGDLADRAEWECDDTAIAQVEAGLVTAVGEGLARVKARADSIESQTVEVQVTAHPVAPLISDARIASGRVFSEGTLQVGSLCYTDRDFEFTYGPSHLLGQAYFVLPNDDKGAAQADYLTFTLGREANLYLLYDVRAGQRGDIRIPPGFADFTPTGDLVGTDDVTRDVFVKRFAPGPVVLPGNTGGETGAGSNYNIVVVPA